MRQTYYLDKQKSGEEGCDAAAERIPRGRLSPSETPKEKVGLTLLPANMISQLQSPAETDWQAASTQWHTSNSVRAAANSRSSSDTVGVTVAGGHATFLNDGAFDRDPISLDTAGQSPK